MKLKKVASLCSKTKIFCLYDREESDGEVSQWLGDSSAIYPITGLPYMDEENIYSMFDISAKQQEKIIFVTSARRRETTFPTLTRRNIGLTKRAFHWCTMAAC